MNTYRVWSDQAPGWVALVKADNEDGACDVWRWRYVEAILETEGADPDVDGDRILDGIIIKCAAYEPDMPSFLWIGDAIN